jgi:hypothetical protein
MKMKCDIRVECHALSGDRVNQCGSGETVPKLWLQILGVFGFSFNEI